MRRAAGNAAIAAAMVLAVAMALAAGGCKKKSSEPAGAGAGAGAIQKPPAGANITPTEADNGRKACAAYVEHVCRCARTVPELQSDCDLARAMPQALEMSLRAAMAEGNATNKDRSALVANAHNIYSACIEDDAKLVQRGCRPAAPGR